MSSRRRDHMECSVYLIIVPFDFNESKYTQCLGLRGTHTDSLISIFACRNNVDSGDLLVLLLSQLRWVAEKQSQMNANWRFGENMHVARNK